MWSETKAYFCNNLDTKQSGVCMNLYGRDEQGLVNLDEYKDLTLEIKDILESEVSLKYYYKDKPLFERLKNFPFKLNTIYQWRRKYVRENKNGVCPTLTANMGTGGHNVPLVVDKNGIRKLTPRECARIQGFPDGYKFPKIADSYLYKQIGNSVSVPVVYRIAKNMMLAFNL